MTRHTIHLAVLALLTLSFPSRTLAEIEPEPAAAGYVPDRVCTTCHAGLARTFREIGMARSFYRPRAKRMVEDFEDNHFFHAASGRHYEMRLDGDRLLFKRYVLDENGEPEHEIEIEVDWILGSGNHSRTYLFRTPSGHLFQLPLAWYAESGWRMAPGFEGQEHLGLNRRVHRECMFCHNAYPETPAVEKRFGDDHFDPHTFPAELPEGIGCQRCHGPGAEHVRLAEETEDYPATRAAITNPAKLEPERRDDICFSCHLQPSIALFGVRRFDRTDYSFRPGENLAEYMVLVDVDEEGTTRSERFEINHHPYRLRQSRCYEASGPEKMSCLTCHDPHVKVPPEERAAHYRRACLTCHEVDACRLEEMTASLPEGEKPAWDGVPAKTVPADDCVACHMPKHRPRDVVHVVMTDHLIRRRPGGPELVAPREHETPVLVGIDFLFPENAPEGDLGELYKAVAVQRAGGNPSSLAHLERMLGRLAPDEIVPWLDLTKGSLEQGHAAKAEKAAREALARDPEDAQAREWLAIARTRQGDIEGATVLLETLVDEGLARPEARSNLGALLFGIGKYEAAAEHLEAVVTARPNLAIAWVHLGRVRAARGEVDAAEAAYRRAIAVEPSLEKRVEPYLDALR